MDVMDDVQRETRVNQQSSASAEGETREATATVLQTARLLANPRRVRRA